MRLLIPFLLGAAAGAAWAQPTPATAVARDSIPRRVKLPTIGRNTRAVLLGAGFVGATVAMFDSPLSSEAQRLGGDDMRLSSSIGSFIGGPVPLALGVGMYAAGRSGDIGFATRTGREVIRAVVVSGAITAVVKGATGRARPFAAPGDPDEFSPGRGFTNGALASFPSGHTSAAFATATVLEREIHAVRPAWSRVARPLLFGGAAFVGFSRIYQAQHWPTDVLAGATLGTITGFEVVAHSRGDRSPLRLGAVSHILVGARHDRLVVGWTQR